MKNIKNYEAMAKLDLTDAEREFISEYADRVLGFANDFSSIDTDNVEPMYTVLDVCNVLREDVSVKMLSKEELLSNSPMQYDGYFQVPKTW